MRASTSLGQSGADAPVRARPPGRALTRRTLLGGLLTAPLAAPSTRGGLYAYVGCYTTAQRSARGDGIHVYRIDPQSAAWTHVQRVGDLVNPSFLVMAADQRHLYSVHGDETYATAFSVDLTNGFLQPMNRAETGGRNGVHQAIDPSGRFLVVANYAAGNVGVLPIRPDGGLADAVQVVALPGQPGPHRIEQVSSHPHHVVFDPGTQSYVEYSCRENSGFASARLFRSRVLVSCLRASVFSHYRMNKGSASCPMRPS